MEPRIELEMFIPEPAWAWSEVHWGREAELDRGEMYCSQVAMKITAEPLGSLRS